MRKIRLTESELISLIKKVINEQEEYSDFTRVNKFKNCNGLRLSDSPEGMSKSADRPDRFVPDSMPSTSSREERMAFKQQKTEDEEKLKEFNRTNNTKIKDLQYFRALMDDAIKIKNYNATGNYNGLFNEEGKPFTKNLTQQKIKTIEVMRAGLSSWYFYFRDVFGNKNPTILDLYEYIESIGGVEKYKELDKTGYNAKKYLDILSKIVDETNETLRSKFPFKKPSSSTPFYFAWNEGKVQKIRYFNTYEEWRLSLEIAKTEGNRPSSEKEDGSATSGEALFSSKPTLGEATPQLFK
jgi:hypothetical protein